MLMHTRKGTTIVTQQEKVTNETRQQMNNLFQRLWSVRSFCCRESVFSYLRRAVFILSQANAETMLDFRKPEKKHIKYNNNSGLPVKVLLKAIRIAWDFFEPSL